MVRGVIVDKNIVQLIATAIQAIKQLGSVRSPAQSQCNTALQVVDVRTNLRIFAERAKLDGLTVKQVY